MDYRFYAGNFGKKLYNDSKDFSFNLLKKKSFRSTDTAIDKIVKFKQ